MAEQTAIQTAFKAAFEDLAAAKRMACIEEQEVLPPKMYADLVAALLSVCGNAEVVSDGVY